MRRAPAIAGRTAARWNCCRLPVHRQYLQCGLCQLLKQAQLLVRFHRTAYAHVSSTKTQLASRPSCTCSASRATGRTARPRCTPIDSAPQYRTADDECGVLVSARRAEHTLHGWAEHAARRRNGTHSCTCHFTEQPIAGISEVAMHSFIILEFLKGKFSQLQQ